MILAEQLTRRFGHTTAVDGLSFEVGRGEIVGLLGPNGAGKTTTLRMIAGYLTPSSGRLLVGGLPVTEESLEIRRRIGYLPEHCPLYTDMRVDEYLRHRAALKGVPPRRVRARATEVRERCGLGEVGRRIIGQLSKGYRQRVGLADALVHDPELLILDEPTLGLDPNQIRQVRDLIRGLGGRHTVLLSSHILPEVEATCGRVMILHQGRLIAADSSENLRRRLQRAARVTVELQAPMDDLRAELAPLARGGTLEVEEQDGWLRVRFEGDGTDDPRAAVFAAAARRGWTLRELHRAEQTLEDVFMELTGPAGPGGRP